MGKLLANKEEIKYSIIVPMYNVEKYIEECISSVINQTYHNWEMIIVNDGSEDRSYEFASRYAEKDSRIVLLQKEHGGSAQARNEGLRRSTGEYIALLDGDDYWESHHLERVNSVLEQDECDMCIMNNHINFTQKWQNRVELFPMPKNDKLSLEDALHLIFDSRYHVPGAAVLTIYRKKFLISNGIAYDPQYVSSEDLDFFLQSILKVKKMKFCDHSFYYYRQDNTNAKTRNMNGERLFSRLAICKKWYMFFQDNETLCDCKREIQDFLSRNIRNNLEQFLRLSHEDRYYMQVSHFYKENRSIWCGKSYIKYIGQFYIKRIYVMPQEFVHRQLKNIKKLFDGR